MPDTITVTIGGVKKTYTAEQWERFKTENDGKIDINDFITTNEDNKVDAKIANIDTEGMDEDDLRATLTDLEKYDRDLRNDKNKLTREIKALNTKINDAKKEIKRLQGLRDEAIAQKKAEEDRGSALQADYDNTLNQIAENNKKAANIKATVESAILDVKQQSRDAIRRETYKAVSNYNPQKDGPWDEFLQGRLKGIAPDSTLTGYIQNLVTISSDIDAATRGLYFRLTSISNKIDECQANISRLEDDIDNYNDDIASQRTIVTNAQTDIDTKTAQLADIDDKIEQNELNMDGVRADILEAQTKDKGDGEVDGDGAEPLAKGADNTEYDVDGDVFMKYLLQNERWLSDRDNPDDPRKTDGKIDLEELKQFFTGNHMEVGEDFKITDEAFNEWFDANSSVTKNGCYAIDAYFFGKDGKGGVAKDLGLEDATIEDCREIMRRSVVQFVEDLTGFKDIDATKRQLKDLQKELDTSIIHKTAIDLAGNDWDKNDNDEALVYVVEEIVTASPEELAGMIALDDKKTDNLITDKENAQIFNKEFGGISVRSIAFENLKTEAYDILDKDEIEPSRTVQRDVERISEKDGNYREINSALKKYTKANDVIAFVQEYMEHNGIKDPEELLEALCGPKEDNFASVRGEIYNTIMKAYSEVILENKAKNQ